MQDESKQERDMGTGSDKRMKAHRHTLLHDAGAGAERSVVVEGIVSVCVARTTNIELWGWTNPKRTKTAILPRRGTSGVQGVEAEQMQGATRKQ